MTALSRKETLYLGFMLFAVFFGASNLIFPPQLGHEAGYNLWEAMAGYLITSVGLPVIAVAAIAKFNNLQTITNLVHPTFGFFFTMGTYLMLGPFLVIPRSGSVAFEMGLIPLLPESWQTSSWTLCLYSLIYFSINFWICLHPSKLFNLIGKILTPILLTMIIIMFIQSLIHPIGDYDIPNENYAHHATFTGIIEGYLTMDVLCALMFGNVIISAIRNRGITDPRKVSVTTIKAGIIAGICLASIYLIIGCLGAKSHSLITAVSHGGQILPSITMFLFGNGGIFSLSIVSTLACMTTSVGLSAACGEYFTSIMPRISYRIWVGIVSLVSIGICNLGLDKIVSFSKPIVAIIYPISIVLIVLALICRKEYSAVYRGSVIATALISVGAGLQEMNIEINILNEVYHYFPLYNIGLGWVIPSILGAISGYIWKIVSGHTMKEKNKE